MNDHEIDRMLQNAGEEWRANVPSPRAFVLHRTERRQGGIMSLVAGAILGVLLLGVTLVAIQSALVRTSDRAGRDSADPASLVVGRDDRVEGLGNVLIARGAMPQLCELAAIRFVAGERPGCSPISVPLSGLDAASVPALHDFNGVMVSDRVSVLGTWTGTALVVEKVRASPVAPSNPVPCTEPAGGWPPQPSSGLEAENALRPLASEVAGHDDLYAGLWSASLPDGGEVEVVATVDRSEQLVATLHSIYPFALCVVSVEFSARDLHEAAATFSRSDGTWKAEILWARNRVFVSVPILTERDAALFAKHPEAVAQPLLVPASR